jgi:1,4-dihydroxy-2-naphthoyl-CoA synthase
MEMLSSRIAGIRVTSEAQEGLSAFLEKRRTRWSAVASEKGKAKKGSKKGKN